MNYFNLQVDLVRYTLILVIVINCEFFQKKIKFNRFDQKTILLLKTICFWSFILEAWIQFKFKLKSCIDQKENQTLYCRIRTELEKFIIIL